MAITSPTNNFYTQETPMAFNKNPSKAEDIVNYQQSNQDNRYVVSNYANASK